MSIIQEALLIACNCRECVSDWTGGMRLPCSITQSNHIENILPGASKANPISLIDQY